MNEKQPHALSSLAASAALMPKESMMEIRKKEKQLFFRLIRPDQAFGNIPLMPEFINMDTPAFAVERWRLGAPSARAR